jgi:hypothetical protein
MGISFSTGGNLSGTGTNRIASLGNIIQVIEGQHGGALSTSATSNQGLFSQAITLQSASNGIAYYYNCAQRCDAGDGPWNLGYHVILGNGSTLANSSWNGFTNNSIINYSRMGYWEPGSVGPHTIAVQVFAYPGCNVQFNSPGNQGNEGIAVLRLMEIQRTNPALPS